VEQQRAATGPPSTKDSPVKTIMRILISSFFVCIAIVDILRMGANASYGDMQPYYLECVWSCVDAQDESSCQEKQKPSQQHQHQQQQQQQHSFLHRTCQEACEYKCMRAITNERKSKGLAVYKYYGHWCFDRHLGLEEPASVLFSLLNALPHVKQILAKLMLVLLSSSSSPSSPTAATTSGVSTLLIDKDASAKLCTSGNKSRSSNSYMALHLDFYPYIALVAWISSAVFHAKKTPLTSLIDYCGALVFIAFGLWLSMRKVLETPLSLRQRPWLVILLFSCLSALVAARLVAMYSGSISFDQHMQLCIGLTCATVVLWAAWLLVPLVFRSKSTENKNNNNRLLCLACQIGFCLAALLELFDFPPLFGAFDAHSLWHLCTVPLGFLWYVFWEGEIKREEEEEEEEKENDSRTQGSTK